LVVVLAISSWEAILDAVSYPCGVSVTCSAIGYEYAAACVYSDDWSRGGSCGVTHDMTSHAYASANKTEYT
jgi:hypothetical protein